MNRLAKAALVAPFLALALGGIAQAASDTPTASEQPAPPKGRAVINFANLPHRIDSWQADGTKGIYLKVGVKQWYHATFMAPCIDLPYTETIGIATDGLAQVDKFSSIVVGSPGGMVQRCWFKSFEKLDGPPQKAKK